MTIKKRIADALAITADALDRGSAATAVRQADVYLGDIESNPEFQILYAHEMVAVAAPVYVEEKRPAGDPVTIAKKRQGLIVVFSDSFILTREKGWGFHQTQAFGFNEVSIESVTAILQGAETPALRIRTNSGKTTAVAAIELARFDSDPAQRVAIRDEIVSRLCGVGTIDA